MMNVWRIKKSNDLDYNFRDPKKYALDNKMIIAYFNVSFQPAFV